MMGTVIVRCLLFVFGGCMIYATLIDDSLYTLFVTAP